MLMILLSTIISKPKKAFCVIYIHTYIFFKKIEICQYITFISLKIINFHPSLRENIGKEIGEKMMAPLPGCLSISLQP